MSADGKGVREAAGVDPAELNVYGGAVTGDGRRILPLKNQSGFANSPTAALAVLELTGEISGQNGAVDSEKLNFGSVEEVKTLKEKLFDLRSLLFNQDNNHYLVSILAFFRNYCCYQFYNPR